MATVQLSIVTPGASGVVPAPSRLDRTIGEALNILVWEGVVALAALVMAAPFVLALLALWLGRVMVAEKEHEWLFDASLNDATERTTVHIDSRLASGILRAELRGLRPTKGMPEYSHPRHVEPPRELAGWVRSV
jgi:hypothetical protein